MFNKRELNLLKETCLYALSHSRSLTDAYSLKEICDKIDGYLEEVKLPPVAESRIDDLIFERTDGILPKRILEKQKERLIKELIANRLGEEEW